ncbi:hypothetical protein ABTZ99_23405 [Actinosynnema sp. NPDC002837]
MRKTNILARGLAVLFLSVVAAISLVAPASAAPTADAVDAGGPVPAAGSTVAPLQLISYISNETSISIGVSKDNVAGSYQALLPAHRRTDGSPLYWSRALSFYVGAGGYCADAWFYDAGAWHPYVTVKGPLEYFVPQTVIGESVARWAVRNHRRC